jgi:hypothetical protein
METTPGSAPEAGEYGKDPVESERERLRAIQVRHTSAMAETGLLGRAVLATPPRSKARMARPGVEAECMVYSRPAIVSSGGSVVVDPSLTETGVCFRILDHSVQAKVYIPVHFSGTGRLTGTGQVRMLPEVSRFFTPEDAWIITALAADLIESKDTDDGDLPHLSNDCTEIYSPGMYLG